MNTNFTERFPKIIYDSDRKIYFYAEKKKEISNRMKNRIEKLNIPKVYLTLWVNNDRKTPNGLIAVALDNKQRKQYYYSTVHIITRQKEKMKRMIKFMRVLPKLRRQVSADILSKRYSKVFLVSNMINILDKTYMRIGNLKYHHENNSHILSFAPDKSPIDHLKRIFLSIVDPTTVSQHVQGPHIQSLSNEQNVPQQVFLPCRDISFFEK